jgi:hypothetical protein
MRLDRLRFLQAINANYMAKGEADRYLLQGATHSPQAHNMGFLHASVDDTIENRIATRWGLF